jgi:hypothetical protein
VGEGGGPTIEEVAEVPGMTTTGTDTGEPEAESPQRGPEGAAAGAGGGRGWQEGHEIKENDHIVIQETLTEPNLVLKEQLAQLQDDNMKLTIDLQLEQHVKKKLAKKLRQLQKNLDELKAFIELKGQEAACLQEQ